jgi:hypothetical protein
MRSITGVSLPASIRSFRTWRSSRLCLASKGARVWDTNGDNAAALTIRSIGPTHRPDDSPLLRMSLPLGVRARRMAAGERVPASWKTRS